MVQQEIDEILARNKQWSENHLKSDPSFFVELSKLHRPKYLWIGCSDARVPANEILGLDPGDVFVHRNIANLVIPTDINLMSVIQYAVEVLEVPHIILCGHYGCGGVRSAMANVDHMPPLENWLSHIRDVQRYHQKELGGIRQTPADSEKKYDRLVELNVLEQTFNLFKLGVVQRRRVFTSLNKDKFPYVQPQVHPMVYNTSNGLLTELAVNVREFMKDHRWIYQLHSKKNELFNRYSKTRAGLLQFEEFCSFVLQELQLPKTPEQLHDVFLRVDLDCDGFISYENVRVWLDNF